MHTTSDRIFLTARITIHAAEGTFSREATGTELLNCELWRSVSNAESMHLGEPLAKLGLGLYLYEKD